MNTIFSRLALTASTLLLFSALAFAGTLDDYYLQQFGETGNLQLQKAVLGVSPESTGPARCGMPLKHGLSRDWNLLEPSTQKILAKQLALPVLTGSELTLISPSGRFKIHYTTAGTDKVPDLAWVQTVAQTFDDVAASYVGSGWQLAPTVGGSPYDVYLRNLAPQGYYGLTNSDLSVSSTGYPNAYSSWMELDNDFLEDIFIHPSGGGTYTALQSLQITAAHEYHHAIQYGYNYYFDIWYAEATSTWMEDELYDSVNQLYNYIPAWFERSKLSLDITDSVTTGGGYGRWIFNRYLTEKHGANTIRGAWEKLATINSPGANRDIPMDPVLESLLSSSTYSSSLGTDFFGFAKRVYTGGWTTHLTELDKIPAYSPVTTYSSYPVNSSNAQKPSVTLPHYSFAYYTFKNVSDTSPLSISVGGTSGIKSALFINGTEVTANANSTSYTVNNFGVADTVVLLIANTTGTDNHSASFIADTTIIVPPTPQPPEQPSGSSSGGGGGCFIATAAYGSYLHPQVRLLRDFRDNHLLTNAPGRAFVGFYYRNSPPVADFIAKHSLLRGITRLALTPVIILVVHPLAAGTGMLLAVALLYRPLRRRYLLHADNIN